MATMKTKIKIPTRLSILVDFFPEEGVWMPTTACSMAAMALHQTFGPGVSIQVRSISTVDDHDRGDPLMTKTNPHDVVTMTPILGGLTIEPMLYRMEDGTPRRLHRRRRTDWRWRVWQWRGTSPENFAVQTVTEVVDTLRSHGFDLTEADLTQTFTLTLNVTRTAPR